ncbi:MAG TPA: DUF1761 domain-containing protein [Bacteroidetes bacterium]|nr:DUF1761 domain-containing protein [Bacteroidota bacterium]
MARMPVRQPDFWQDCWWDWPWVVTSFGINYLFTRRSFVLFLIDAGYYVLLFPVMGIIPGAW